MIGQEKDVKPQQAELDHYRILLDTMLDYHLKHHTGSMVFDEWDPSAEYYLQQKKQSEKDFESGRLDKLQQMFAKLANDLLHKGGATIRVLDVQSENGGLPIPECKVIVEVLDTGIPLVAENDLEQYFSRKPTEFNFPDSLRRIMVRSNGTGDRALTEVSIVLKGGSGCIYCVTGENLPIQAYWKNKNTIVIETREAYEISIRHHQVSSFDDVIKIEYINL